jgi:hypothetical protein
MVFWVTIPVILYVVANILEEPHIFKYFYLAHGDSRFLRNIGNHL